ncbi:MAG TPA: YceI family protein [Niabella sp.]|jgi:polyisoprenoid-binding protein YceI|nr:YceI family protein [Chitinophagaceae bacterium]HRO83347.1 YceI family protein [Niabella sp.]HUN03589.1 YceI family protein [Niabella sp.]
MTETTKWVLDPAHSELLFKVRHLMISNVKGEFKEFNASIDAVGDDFTNAKATATIQTASVFTNQNDRDNHLKSADFFEVEKYPEIKFESKELTKVDDENFKLTGALTIRDITKDITLDVEFGGVTKDPYGQTKAGFTFSGKVNRTDFGLKWNVALETGGVLVGEDVKINGELQFVKQ